MLPERCQPCQEAAAQGLHTVPEGRAMGLGRSFHRLPSVSRQAVTHMGNIHARAHAAATSRGGSRNAQITPHVPVAFPLSHTAPCSLPYSGARERPWRRGWGRGAGAGGWAVRGPSTGRKVGEVAVSNAT